MNFKDCRNSNIQFLGRSLFWYFSTKKDRNEPRNNPWILDVRKIVVPNVSVDTKLIDIVTNHYEPATRTIRKMDGMSLLVMKKSCIKQFFGLGTHALTKIDRD